MAMSIFHPLCCATSDLSFLVLHTARGERHHAIPFPFLPPVNKHMSLLHTN